MDEIDQNSDRAAYCCRTYDIYNAKIAKIATGQFNLQAIDDRTILILKIADLALGHLLNGNFDEARNTADCVISAVPNSPLLKIRRAPALMFLNRVDEARELYRKYRAQKVDAERYGKDVIARDFAAMREAGLLHSLMDEIEK
jgi:hypothetical protein